MHQQYRDRAGFLAVYIREAHPTDEWRTAYNDKEGVCYLQPRAIEQRVAIARDFIAKFDFTIPLLVDGMENSAEKSYSAWPERLYVVDEAGVIAYKGRPGPVHYHPAEVEAWLKEHVPPASPAPTGAS